MATLLIKNATLLLSGDPATPEIADGGLFARDGWIEAVGPSHALPRHADTVLDLAHHVVIPGLVNTHHHLFQTMTRAVPAAENAPLFDWLRALYPIWARMGPQHIKVSAMVGMAELALSGCTTTSDHLYMYPNGARLEDTIEAAQAVGLRFHPTRGAMSIGQSQGGLPPDSLVEREDAILKDCERVIHAFHDPKPGSLVRVGVAPCSPFSVSKELMRDAALLARKHGVRLHTHLAENDQDIAYSHEKFGCSPGVYAENLGWTGSDVWHAHCVKLDQPAIARFASSGTGIAHCPTSNMRLGSGAAPVKSWLEAGVNVGLGVDGSASNDGSHMLAEARQTLLLARVNGYAMPARQALKLATKGGAAVLGRPDIGALKPGMAADIAAFDLRTIEFAGHHDPLSALILCGPLRAATTIVHGRVIVEAGRLCTLELAPLLTTHNRLAKALLNDERAV